MLFFIVTNKRQETARICEIRAVESAQMALSKGQTPTPVAQPLDASREELEASMITGLDGYGNIIIQRRLIWTSRPEAAVLWQQVEAARERGWVIDYSDNDGNCRYQSSQTAQTYKQYADMSVHKKAQKEKMGFFSKLKSLLK